MKREGQIAQKGALELLEEAVHLLRTTPVTVLAGYYIGALPFVLAVLYFWADMSRSPYAYQHLAGYSLALGVLFLWMKFWQVLFARQLLGLVTGISRAWDARRCWRLAVSQAALQPSGLFVLPLSLSALALPLPTAFAFYQNVTALADTEAMDVGLLFKRAAKQALIWPGQNRKVLLV